VREYDAVGLDRTLNPPDNLLARARGCGCVLASDLPRSLESATWFGSERSVVVGHGMFNRLVAARLRPRGWRGPMVLPSAYWSAAAFTGPVSDRQA
jgi:hypothetical protein